MIQSPGCFWPRAHAGVFRATWEFKLDGALTDLVFIYNGSELVCIPSREEIVRHGDFVSLEHELVDEVGTDETTTACDEDPLSVLVIEKLHLRISRSRVAAGEI